MLIASGKQLFGGWSAMEEDQGMLQIKGTAGQASALLKSRH